MPIRRTLVLLLAFALACSAPRRYQDDTNDADHDGVDAPLDCDDHDPAVHPGAPEKCNGKDDDCDGKIDPPDSVDAKTWYRDVDGDGYGDTAHSQKACTAPAGFVGKGGDCDDAQAAVHPGAHETTCNDIDDDCDATTLDAPDADHDGITVCAGDCDDSDASVHPGATEICDGKDNDCNGRIDDGLPTTAYWPDADGDGYGSSSAAAIAVCGPAPAGYATNANDCDDAHATSHPGAAEIACNGRDDDCNPATPDGPDADGDGVSACGGDCDDHDPLVHPGAPERCNGKDDNCDGQIDEGLPRAHYYPDADGDGHGTSTGQLTACGAPAGYAPVGDDCDDHHADVYPGAPERCDGVDRNCDGTWSALVPSVCSTIQTAIDASRSGQTITVAPGTYRENVNFHGLDVNVVGSGGASQTILDGGNNGPVVTFQGGETNAAILDGFTIRNGSGFRDTSDCQNGKCSRYGGGILVTGASPTLQHLVITANNLVETNGWSFGGGIAFRQSDAVVRASSLVGNSSDYYGGAVYLDSSSNVAFEQVTISGNQAGIGGGVANYYGHVTFTNAVFTANNGGTAGALFCQAGTTTLTNATIHGNTAGYEGAALALTSGASVTLTNAAISSNTSRSGNSIDTPTATTLALRYCDVNGNSGTAPTLTGTTSFNAFPNYVNVSGDASTWDLHPKAGSALIDAGDPAVSDADGSRSDIGAYGGPKGSW